MKFIPILVIVVTLIICAQLVKGKLVKVGDSCCQEDWERTTGVVVNAFTKYGNNPLHPTFIEAYRKWEESLNELHDREEPEGTCQGSLYFKCEAGKCICNNVGGMVSVFQEKVETGGNFPYEEVRTCRGSKDTFCLNSIYSHAQYMECVKDFQCLDWKDVKGFRRCQTSDSTGVQELDANGNVKGGSVANSISTIWLLVFLAFGILHSFEI